MQLTMQQQLRAQQALMQAQLRAAQAQVQQYQEQVNGGTGGHLRFAFQGTVSHVPGMWLPSQRVDLSGRCSSLCVRVQLGWP